MLVAALLRGINIGPRKRISVPASFATQLQELVEHVDLPDAAWLREFRFRTEIQGRTSSWASAAGTYRNRVFHSAFIDFETYDIDNAVAFIPHLSDVLGRVVFQLIGFDDQYKPPCGAHGAAMHERPDWPKSAALGGELFGYVDTTRRYLHYEVETPATAGA